MCKICDGTSIGQGTRLLIRCDKVTHVTEKSLNKRLKYLIFADCPNLIELPRELGKNIRILELKGCTNLAKLPELKDTKLVNLHVTNCPSLIYLPILPKKLYLLYLNNCKNIQPSESNFIPERVEHLYLENLPSMWLRTLILPENLRILNLIKLHINHLTKNLPFGLKELVCNNCDKVKIELDQLPDFLKLEWHGSRCFTGECITSRVRGCRRVASTNLKFDRIELVKIQRFLKMRLKIRRLLRIARIEYCIQFPDISKIIAGYN